MNDPQAQAELVFAELERLGLDSREIPGLAFGDGEEGVERFLAHIRSLAPGVTWREVLPDLPAHWILGEPETWTVPYAPFGPYDYAELPTGPAIHLIWDGAQDPGWIGRLLTGAGAAGWPVYGGGPAPGTDAATTRHAFIVLERSVSREMVDGFVEWASAQPSLSVATVARQGEEIYYNPRSDTSSR
jgi:hypothetical protein